MISDDDTDGDGDSDSTHYDVQHQRLIATSTKIKMLQ